MTGNGPEREELRAASKALTAASDATEDPSVSKRLRAQADQLTRLADRTSGPDHGRLARHEHVLREILTATSGTAADRIEAAEEHIAAYRETIEGV